MRPEPVIGSTVEVRAISFDLDDTLWAIAPVIERAEKTLHDWFDQHCPEVSSNYTMADLRLLRERLALEHPQRAHDFAFMRRITLARVIDDLGLDQELVERAYQVFFSVRNEVQLFDETLPVLERLAGRYPLACISNGNADVDIIGIGHLFAVRVQARHIGRPKPHPAIFRAALDQLTLRPEELVHVGDCLEADVMGALASGIRAVWMNYRGDPRTPPDGVITIDRLDQLPAAIEALSAAA